MTTPSQHRDRRRLLEHAHRAGDPGAAVRVVDRRGVEQYQPGDDIGVVAGQERRHGAAQALPDHDDRSQAELVDLRLQRGRGAGERTVLGGRAGAGTVVEDHTAAGVGARPSGTPGEELRRSPPRRPAAAARAVRCRRRCGRRLTAWVLLLIGGVILHDRSLRRRRRHGRRPEASVLADQPGERPAPVEPAGIRQHPESCPADVPALGPELGSRGTERHPERGDPEEPDPSRPDPVDRLDQPRHAGAQLVGRELVGAGGGSGHQAGDADPQAREPELLLGSELVRGEPGSVEHRPEPVPGTGEVQTVHKGALPGVDPAEQDRRRRITGSGKDVGEVPRSSSSGHPPSHGGNSSRWSRRRSRRAPSAARYPHRSRSVVHRSVHRWITWGRFTAS